MRREIGQHIMMGLRGTSLTSAEADFIVANNICGVVLFQRNCESPEQIYELTRSLQDLPKRMADSVPLFIGIDMEGGSVHRLKSPYTQWPSLADLAKHDSASLCFHFANMMGEELKMSGINLNFSPCVDVLTEKNNSVIGSRSIGSDYQQVAKLASALVRGFIKSGVLPCAKHFPGHGNTSVDSHEALPEDEASLDKLISGPMEPFKKVFRARLSCVMSAHIRFSKVDNRWPASLSSIFLKDILRDQFRYKGLVFTDDLGMGALKGFTTEEIAEQAVLSGSQVLLYCNDFEAPMVAMEALEKAYQDRRLRPEVLKSNVEIIHQVKSKTFQGPISKRRLMGVLNEESHKKLSEGIVSGNIPSSMLSQVG